MLLSFILGKAKCVIKVLRIPPMNDFEALPPLEFNPLNPELNPICYLLALL